MSVIGSNALAGAAGQSAAGGGGFQISRSLRFNSADSSSLTQSSYSGSGTFSCWVKRCKLGAAQTIITNVAFAADDTLNGSTAVFRDPSAWMHIVVSTGGTYVNGVSVGSGSAVTPSAIGSGCDLYLANVQFIDGQALAPTDFGEVDSDTGVWNPKAYSGSYNTNGFHLNFADNSSSAALGTDAAGSNNWTVNNLTANASVVTPVFGAWTGYSGGNWATTDTWDSLSDASTNFGNNSGTKGYSSTTASWSGTKTSWSGAFGASNRGANGWALKFASSVTITVNPVATSSIIACADTSTAVSGGTSYTSFPATMTGQVFWFQCSGSPNVEVYNSVGSLPDPATIDSLIDTPTNYTAGSGNNGGNYATLNLLESALTGLNDGNLNSGASGASSWKICTSTIAVTSGKYYWEGFTDQAADSSNGWQWGFCQVGPSSLTDPYGTGKWSYQADSVYNQSSSGTSVGTTAGANDVLAYALDMDGSTIGLPAGYTASGYTGTLANIETDDSSYIEASASHIDFDLGASYTVGTVTFKFKSYNDAASANYRIELYSDSGYSSLLANSSTSNGIDTILTITHDFGSTSARYLRLSYQGGGNTARVYYLSTTGATSTVTTCKLYVNNSLVHTFTGITGTITPFVGSYNNPKVTINFGQRGFAHTPPTGYASLCTTNLPEPTIVGSTYFDTKLYTGNSTNGRSVTGYSFSPDFVWIKGRTANGSATIQHVLQDTVRGTTALLSSSSTGAESAFGTQWGYISSFNSDGFSLTAGSSGPDHNNYNGATYVSWGWDAGTVTNPVGDIWSPGASKYIGIKFASASGGTVSYGQTSGSDTVQVWTSSDNYSWTQQGGTLTLATGHTLTTTDQYVYIRNTTDATFSNWYAAASNGADGHYSGSTYPSGATWSGPGYTDHDFRDGGGTLNTAGTIVSINRASPSSGFSIVSYKGNGVAGDQEIAHGLNAVPAFVIIKNRTSGQSYPQWTIKHKDLTTNKNILFTSAAEITAIGGGGWYEGGIRDFSSSTTFGLGNGANNVNTNVNYSGTDYIAYCFAPVEGYSAFGSYTATGTSDNSAPFIFTGFRPRWIIVKASSSAGDMSYAGWLIIDTERDSYNVADASLLANSSAVEGTRGDGSGTAGSWMDILSNGFKIRYSGTDVNGTSGQTYIYAAFGDPFKTARAR